MKNTQETTFCINHKEEIAEYHCSDCGKNFCEVCVHYKGAGNDKIATCPDCGFHLDYEPKPLKTLGFFEKVKKLFAFKKEPVEPTAFDYLTDARGYKNKRNYQLALESYNKAINLNHHLNEALDERFYLLTEMNRKEEAVKAGIELVNYYVSIKDKDQAIIFYGRIDSLDSKADPGLETLWQLGEWLLASLRYNEAATTFRKAAIFYPDNEKAAEALFITAEIFRNELANPKRAEKVYSYLGGKYTKSAFAQKAHQVLQEMKQR